MDTVDALYQAGSAAWPTLALDPAVFRQHVSARFVDAAVPDGLRGADLYLACACIQGDGAAQALFEREHLQRVPLYLAGMNLSGAQVEEVQQQLRVKLLSPPAPKLGEYSGRATLVTWLRTSAVNTALHLVERAEERKRQDLNEDWFDRIPAHGPDGDGAELAALKRLDGVAFKEAVALALAALAPEERNLLRFHYLDGMTMEAIGALRKVNKSTVSRELAKLRERLLLAVQRELGQRCRLDAAEVASLAGFLVSQIDLSLSRILGR